jgi:anti-sigma28 factor (negative regulator of flagellin synthesis)
MALSATDKREIEVLIRKEIKSFLNSNTLNQFENKMIELVRKEITKGKMRGDVNDIVTNIMREFYRLMWTQRSFWEPNLRNVKS